MFERYFEEVKARSEIKVIYQIAIKRLSEGFRHRDNGSSDEAAKSFARAEGMVIATAFLDDSPFDNATDPVTVLYRINEDDELVKKLYL